MENPKTNYSKPLDKAGNGLGINDPVERTAAGAHETVDKIATATHQAADVLQEKGEQLQQLQQDWTKNVRRYVDSHPLQSLGIAIAGGFLLSRLLSGR